MGQGLFNVHYRMQKYLSPVQLVESTNYFTDVNQVLTGRIKFLIKIE